MPLLHGFCKTPCSVSMRHRARCALTEWPAVQVRQPPRHAQTAGPADQRRRVPHARTRGGLVPCEPVCAVYDRRHVARRPTRLIAPCSMAPSELSPAGPARRRFVHHVLCDFGMHGRGVRSRGVLGDRGSRRSRYTSLSRPNCRRYWTCWRHPTMPAWTTTTGPDTPTLPAHRAYLLPVRPSLTASRAYSIYCDIKRLVFVPRHAKT
jgi:hypothetical protein